MAIERVEMWRTSDGTAYDTLEGAQRHESTLTRLNAVRKLVGEHCYSGMTPDDICDFIFDYQDEIKEALK